MNKIERGEQRIKKCNQSSTNQRKLYDSQLQHSQQQTTVANAITTTSGNCSLLASTTLAVNSTNNNNNNNESTSARLLNNDRYLVEWTSQTKPSNQYTIKTESVINIYFGKSKG